MKKLLLILLCVPLMFSCGENEKDIDSAEIISKYRVKKLDHVFIRMERPDNTVVDEDGVIVAIVGSGDGEYSIKQIRTIVKSVTNGTLKGDNLDYVLKQLPKELKDGSGFRSSFTIEMKELEKTAEKKIIIE